MVNVQKFKGKRILVIGDVMLDEYIYAKGVGVSPEAPVLKMEVEKKEYFPGGAANVANNIKTLGGNFHLLGVAGPDWEYDELFMALMSDWDKENRCDICAPIGLRTTLKTRVLNNNIQYLRVDRDIDFLMDDVLWRKVEFLIEKYNKPYNAIVVSDYGKGVVSPLLVKFIRKYNKENPIVPIILDPKPSNEDIYYTFPFDVMTPNFKEAEEFRQGNYDNLPTDTIVTLGSKGYMLNRTGMVYQSLNVNCKDVTGAGDSFVAGLALSMASGYSIEESAEMANIVAGLSVTKDGPGTVNNNELQQYLEGREDV